MKKLIYGVGFNDRKYPARINGRDTKEYKLWIHMLGRCYSESVLLRRPTYIGCSVSENFKSFSFFVEWCRRQAGFDLGWQLDKDLLKKGNKTYSEYTCIFVPRHINNALTKCDASRGMYPIGVSYSKSAKMFRATLGKLDKIQHLGCFASEHDAFLAYKKAKEAYLSELADKYADNLDPRAYAALKAYIVEIDD